MKPGSVDIATTAPRCAAGVTAAMMVDKMGTVMGLPEERRVVIMRYRSLGVAQKVVGVGSVGTRCAVVLALGGSEGDDPLFMQIKEAGASVLEPYLGASPYPNHGQRMVVGQRLMQAASDIFLGWTTFGGRDYYA